MASTRATTLLSALGGAIFVAAHGHIANFIINGVQWPGFDPTKDPYMKDPPTVAGWTTGATDNGFVDGSSYSSADIICHKNSQNAKGHAVVAAGDQVFLPWDTWPESHKGPVVDYLADCGAAGCEAVDKSTLKFFKIGEVGLIDGSKTPGEWGSDQLIKNGNAWMVQIPAGIAPGNYVLRHEMIALHAAGQAGQAQNYPQCINLEVTGSSTDRPEGVLGTELHKTDNPGIRINIYQPLSTYRIPGPLLYEGASSIQQARSQATATTTAITGGAAGPPPSLARKDAVLTSGPSPASHSRAGGAVGAIEPERTGLVSKNRRHAREVPV